MRKIFLIILQTALLTTLKAETGIDMQAHIQSDEGQSAYTTYTNAQSAYYVGEYTYSNLICLNGNELFGKLNSLMGITCRVGGSEYSYNSLRPAYIDVDRDLNTRDYIIGYYDGRSMQGAWGTGYNREHTWPQSKGADKSIPMGHDMQSVRPTSESVNSDRGNAAYGESGNYYDPDDVSINNPHYKSSNLGTYRGDAARVILYDYIVYGESGGYKNMLYNGNAQLLSKLGTSGVFESIGILLKWHMQDPPSLTEMVRNDGAEDYQGNRNPFIDFPELAVEMLKNHVTTYSVTCQMADDMHPAYKHTTSDGFIAYLSHNGIHPNEVIVDGAIGKYDRQTGRLIIDKVTKDVRITTDTETGLNHTTHEQHEQKKFTKIIRNGHLLLSDGVNLYTLTGEIMH